MVSILDVAKYILEQRGAMSVWKLHKLCYYSQAWHYTWTERRLIKEEFQAWQNGPVCPELYAAHRYKFAIGADDIQGNVDALTDDDKESIDVVLSDYGGMEPFELAVQVCSEEPYKNTPLESTISLDSMGEYYGSLI